MNGSSNHSREEEELSFIGDDSKERNLKGHSHELNTDACGGEYLALRTQLCSELVGTYILVSIGCGAACVSLYGTQYGLGDNYGTAMINTPLLWTIGATLGIYSAASISGGHLNPAVTLAFALVRPSAFPLRKVLPYWGAQTVGALLAGLTNLLLFHQAIVDWEQKHLPNNVIPSKCKVDGHFVFGAKSTQIRGCKVYDDLQLQGMSAFAGCWNVTDDDSRHRIAVSNEFHAIFIEAFGTAFVVFIIFSVTSPFYPIPGPAVPPVVALSLGAMLYLLGPLTGHHMNPASDIGRRLSGTLWLLVRQGVEVNSDLAQKLGRILQLMWIDCRAYLVGPMIGGPIGAWIADAIQPMY